MPASDALIKGAGFFAIKAYRNGLIPAPGAEMNMWAMRPTVIAAIGDMLPFGNAVTDFYHRPFDMSEDNVKIGIEGERLWYNFFINANRDG